MADFGVVGSVTVVVLLVGCVFSVEGNETGTYRIYPLSEIFLKRKELVLKRKIK